MIDPSYEKHVYLNFMAAALTGLLAANSVRKDGKKIEETAFVIAHNATRIFCAHWAERDTMYAQRRKRTNPPEENPYTESAYW